MASFFKNLVKGFLYVLMFPFGLLAIACYAVFGIFVFIFQFIRMIVLFFTGRSFKNELPEDIAAKKIIEANQPSVESESPLSLYPSDSIVYGSGFVSPMEEKGEDNQLEKEGDDNA